MKWGRLIFKNLELKRFLERNMQLITVSEMKQIYGRKVCADW